jgi:assimilatory nitrate reductase catalytic subunit
LLVIPLILKRFCTANKDIGDESTLATRIGVSEAALNTFFDLFCQTPKTMTCFSMGVNQSSAGTDKVNAIINCHLATGRIGKEGASPFSLTGQPNAMGGREVGGLANMLAAHMDIENPIHRQRVQDFWQSPVIADKSGLKAIDLFDAMYDGKIKAVWIMATNPVVSLPNADKVRAALEKCELVVVSDCIADTDTARLADVLLPSLGWGEKDGTVTNSERRISRQRGFLPAPAQAKPDWWALSQVAQAMGFSGFDYQSPAELFSEHAAIISL